jgi:hypothetical protein
MKAEKISETLEIHSILTWLMALEDFIAFSSCETFRFLYMCDSKAINRVEGVCVVTVGYTTNDVVYRWNRARQVAIAEDMKLSQFDLIATPAANQTDVLQSGRTGVAFCTICKYSFNMTKYIPRYV